MTTYTVPLSYPNAIPLQVTLDGSSYQALIAWNLFGQRSYVQISDQFGNTVVNIPLIGSAQAAEYTYTVSDPQGVQAPKTVTLASVEPINILAGYFQTSVMYYFPASQTLEVLP